MRFCGESVKHVASFDCVGASRCEAATPLRMTAYEFFRSYSLVPFRKPAVSEACQDCIVGWLLRLRSRLPEGQFIFFQDSSE